MAARYNRNVGQIGQLHLVGTHGDKFASQSIGRDRIVVPAVGGARAAEFERAMLVEAEQEGKVPAVTAPMSRAQMQPRRVSIALVCLALLGAAPEFTPPTTLRIATGHSPPFVVPQSDRLSGFDVDLWTELARRLGAGVAVTDLGPNSIEAQLQAVRNGQVDMALSAIAMTPEA